MKRSPFFWSFERNAIIIKGRVNSKTILRFLLDAGATNTSLDSNAIALTGIDIRKPIDKVLLETANGIISTNVYLVDSIDGLGINRVIFPVQVLDFLQRGITSEYDGILGLDFLQGTHFCIDTLHNEITIQ